MVSYQVKQLLISLAANCSSPLAENIAWQILNCIQHKDDWAAFQETLEGCFSQQELAIHPSFVRIYTRALIGTYTPEASAQAATFLKKSIPLHKASITAVLHIEEAIMQLRQNQPQAAFELLEDAILILSRAKLKTPRDKRDLGIAYSRLGQSKAKLQHPDWNTPFQKMREFLSGRDLGIQILQEGNLWYFKDIQKAKACYKEASKLLRKDTLNHAYAESNLGLVLLFECEPEAHQHLEDAEKRTRHKRYTAQHTEFLKALAASHRTRGEWDKAVLLYRRALDRTSQPNLQLEVQTNLVRTYRLANRLTQAQTAIAQAQTLAADNNLNPSVAQLEQIALRLKTQ